jgi:hypothetical protein
LSDVRYARQRDVFPEFGYAPPRDRWRSPFSTW